MENFNPIVWGNFYNPQSAIILRKRILINKLAEESVDVQKRILEKCSEDPVYFINNFVFMADPRNLDSGKPVLTPFQCFKRQEEYIRWRRECRSKKVSGVCLKSRDSGISVLNVADQVHSFLFEKGFRGGMSSRKEKFVDELGNLDSLFEKIRFILKYLPGWMKPVDIQDNYMKIINPGNDSSIVGEAGDNIGRGGRLTIEDVDEAAYIPRMDSVARSLSQTTNCVIFTSTPNGKNNFFANAYLERNFEKFKFLWQQDPRKDDAWYKRMCDTLDELTIAREIDASFEDSGENTIFNYKKLVESINAFFGNFPAPIITMGLDVATSGSNKSVYTIMIAGCAVLEQGEIPFNDINEIAYAGYKIAVKFNCDIVVVDTVGVGEGVVSTLSGIPGRPFKIIPFRGNDKVTNRYWENHNCKSKQLFRNLRAEIYFWIKEKIDNTYLHKKGIRQFDVVDMISFNQDSTNTLFADLERIEAIRDPSGIYKIMSKVEMREQSIKSPDWADSLCLAFAGTVMGKAYRVI